MGRLKYNGSSLVTNSSTISKSMTFFYSVKVSIVLHAGKSPRSMVFGPLHCILRVMSLASVGFPFASGLYVGGKCYFWPLITSSTYSQYYSSITSRMVSKCPVLTATATGCWESRIVGFGSNLLIVFMISMNEL